MVHEAAKTSKISIVIILGRVLLIANVLHSSDDHPYFPYFISLLWNKPAYSHIKNYFPFDKISFSHKTVGVLLLQYLYILRHIGLSNIIYFFLFHLLILYIILFLNISNQSINIQKFVNIKRKSNIGLNVNYKTS